MHILLRELAKIDNLDGDTFCSLVVLTPVNSAGETFADVVSQTVGVVLNTFHQVFIWNRHKYFIVRLIIICHEGNPLSIITRLLSLMNA